MTRSKYWFSPEKIDENNGGILFPHAKRYYENSSKRIEKGSPVSVIIRNVYTNKEFVQEQRLKSRNDLEALLEITGREFRAWFSDYNSEFWQSMKDQIKKSKERRKMARERELHARETAMNDLLIMSSFQVDAEPSAMVLNGFFEGQPIKQAVRSFSTALACSFSDFNYDHLTLGCRLFDVDGYDAAKQMAELVTNNATVIGGIFPVIAPYLNIAGTISLSLVNLIDKADQHDKIVDERLTLYAEDESGTLDLLQTGHWVFFSEEQEDGLKVDLNLNVLNADGSPFDGCSYVVYSIMKREVSVPEFEIPQRIAQIMSELQGKGDLREAASDFLKKTVDGYNKYKKLERYYELKHKTDKGDEEKKALARLEGDTSILSLLPKRGGSE
jgi:hypothetical protein